MDNPNTLYTGLDYPFPRVINIPPEYNGKELQIRVEGERKNTNETLFEGEKAKIEDGEIIIKISDFGLSRVGGKGKGYYKMKESSTIPLRW